MKKQLMLLVAITSLTHMAHAQNPSLQQYGNNGSQQQYENNGKQQQYVNNGKQQQYSGFVQQQSLSFEGFLLGNGGSFETCYAKVRGAVLEITGKNDGAIVYGIWSKATSREIAADKLELFQKATQLAQKNICKKTILINP